MITNKYPMNEGKAILDFISKYRDSCVGNILDIDEVYERRGYNDEIYRSMLDILRLYNNEQIELLDKLHSMEKFKTNS